MGALDIEAKKYLGKKDAFADAFNYLIYDGEPVIDPDSLRDMDTSQIALPYGNNARLPIQKYRDLLRIWDAKTDGNMIYVILGEEIQGKIHYAMPVKDGLYDWIGYSNQVEAARNSYNKKGNDEKDAELCAYNGVLKIKLSSEEFLSGFRKEDRLIPIITAVVYVGSEPWDGPRSLFDMLDIRDERIKPFLNDYKLNIISAADMEESDFQKFHTELGLMMRLLRHQKDDADKIIEETNHKKIDPDAAFFIKEAANLDLEFEIEEDGIDMCKSLENKYKEKEVMGAIGILKDDGKSDEDIIERIIKKYNVTKDYVLALLTPQKA